MALYEIDEDKRIALADYLNDIRNRRGLGHSQLALKAGIDGAVLHKMLYGTVKKANPFHLQALAKALKIDYKVLYQIIGYLDSDEGTPEDKLTIVELEQEIPVYSRVFAGPNGTLEFGEVIEYITIPSLRNGTEVIGIKVDGDSMEHTIPNGATVLVKKDVEVNDKEVGVFVHNNTPYVKRLRKNKDQLFLMSDNSAYLPIIVSEGDEFFIVGKVVEVMYKL